MKEYLKVFDALSDGTRLRIAWVLLKANTPMCVCEIMDSLSEPQYNISRHLRILENAGVVERKREGKWILYFISQKKNDFLNKILEGVSQIEEKVFQSDRIRLKARLSLRKNGKCIVGIGSKEWKKILDIKLKGGANE